MLDLTMSGEGYVSPRFYSIQITPNFKKKNKIKEIDARVFIYKPSSLKIHLDRTKFSV